MADLWRVDSVVGAGF